MRPEIKQAVSALSDALHAVPKEQLTERLWHVGRTQLNAGNRRLLVRSIDAMLRFIYTGHPLDELDGPLELIGTAIGRGCTASTPWGWTIVPDYGLVIFSQADGTPGASLLLELPLVSDETLQSAITSSLYHLIAHLIGASHAEEIFRG